MIHGTNNHRCRCEPCKAAQSGYMRRYWSKRRQLDAPWLLENFPIALVARTAFPDDDAAIAAAFGATT